MGLGYGLPHQLGDFKNDFNFWSGRRSPNQKEMGYMFLEADI
jgi:hypothetical protein